MATGSLVPAPGGGINRRPPEYRPTTPGVPSQRTGGSSSIPTTNINPSPLGGGPSIHSPVTPYATQAERQDPINPTDPIGTQIQQQLDRLLNQRPFSSPTEGRLTNSQQKLQKLQDLQGARDAYSNSPTDLNLAALKQKLVQMGISTENKTPYSLPNPFGAPTGITDHDLYLQLAGDQISQLPTLNKQIGTLASQVVNEKLAGGQAREAELKQGLGTTSDLLSQLIDQRLQEHLGDVSLDAQKQRSDIGASLAARGLNQSSFGAQKVQQSILQEQEQNAQSRAAAVQTKSNFKGTLDDVVKQIDERREKLKTMNTLSEVNAANDVSFDIDAQALSQQFKTDVAQMELDSESEAMLMAMGGNILGGLAKIFIAGGA